MSANAGPGGGEQPLAAPDQGASLTVVVGVADPDVLVQLRDAVDTHPRFMVVATASTGADVLSISERLSPAIVVLDHELPDLAGSDHLTQIRQSSPWVRVVMYSHKGEHPALDSLPETDRAPAGQVAPLATIDADRIVATLDHLASQPLSASWRLDPDTANVAAARRVTGEVLAAWGCDGLIDDAQLVVTELVTNAFVHVGSACTVSLRTTGDGLRIEVTDLDASAPEPQPFDLHREGGRGLLIVSSLATAWGIDPAAGGKTVWADLVA